MRNLPTLIFTGSFFPSLRQVFEIKCFLYLVALSRVLWMRVKVLLWKTVVYWFFNDFQFPV